jgi:uncharacterized protein (TIGR03083 family)
MTSSSGWSRSSSGSGTGSRDCPACARRRRQALGRSLQDVGTDLDYLAHLARESARFAEVIGAVPAAARVPSCPDWSADDLLWHLAEVQWFWATIVRAGMTGSQAEQLKPERPASRAGLLEFWLRASRDLAEILAATPADAPAWTWSQDQTAGFIRRRQAHEALIHRVDAELAAGHRSPMDPRLSADGVDEALRIMYGGDVPAWGQFTPGSAKAIRVQATDTGTSWFVTPGRFAGTDPGDQVCYDEPGIHVAVADPGDVTAAVISGSAADLDCWLWHRPPVMPIDRSGDQEVLSRIDSVIAPGIN